MVKVVAVILAIISVIALAGNGLVVVLFLRKRKWLKKVHSCLLLALAVQDILTAIGLLTLPGFVQSSDAYDVPRSPRSRQFYCRVIWSRYIPFALAITSVYTSLMLAVDRWIAVFKPMSYRRICSSGKVIAIMVIFPWVAGFGFELNTALNVDSAKQQNGSYACLWNKIEHSPKARTIAVFTFIGMIVLPAILMIIAYARIVTRRRKQMTRVLPPLAHLRRNSMAPNHDQMESNSSISLKRLTRIACAASAIVVLCWLPDQFYVCLFQMGLVERRSKFHDGLIIVAFTNTCINPFLYSFFNKQFTEEFEMILCCVYKRERTDSLSRQRST